jgi:hypothetical protein
MNVWLAVLKLRRDEKMAIETTALPGRSPRRVSAPISVADLDAFIAIAEAAQQVVQEFGLPDQRFIAPIEVSVEGLVGALAKLKDASNFSEERK